jgi:thymidylate synthase ThyX
MQARSSWGRNGVAVCLDAGWGDPGYINRWTMEIYNMNQHDSVVLPVGERIAQLVFYATGEVESQYTNLSGKYQAFEDGDLAKLIDGWKPQDMLPRSFKDVRELPQSLSLDKVAARAAAAIASTESVSEILQTRKQIEPQVNENLIQKNEHGAFVITQAGKNYLEDAVTDVDGDVYAFKDKLTNATVAAAMARLSRRGDDMRVTILDEFVSESGRDEGVLQRVITAYGDDSVQQLAGVHFVVENASNLLTKKLEWGRLAAYLEQSTRYIFFDQKDQKGNYKYFTPRNLDADTAREYEKAMDKIFDNYSTMVRRLTKYVRDKSEVPKEERDVAWKGATRAQACDAIRPVLPVSTKSTVGVFASAQAAESLYTHLMSDELLESRETGEGLLKQLREVMPVFYERADRPDRGGAAIAYAANTKKSMRKIAEAKLPQNMSPATDDLTLVDYWPKNELDLLPHMLFDHSSLPLASIEDEVSKWSYDEKVTAYKTYMGERLNRRHKPGRAIENAHYSWEIVCDYGIFRDLQRHRIVDDLRWQELSPRYGFEMPELVEEAGLSDLFEECFDISFSLYSTLQSKGFLNEAQYATLLGHKMRWKITYNAREAFHFHELRTAPQGHPGYRKLVKRMHDKVAQVHPIIADSMKFVNKDEDPALTRLAAERYTQYKLQELDGKSKKAVKK